jgi:hypothetical protein
VNSAGRFVLSALALLVITESASAALIPVVASGFYTTTTRAAGVPPGLTLVPGVTPMETTFIYDTDALLPSSDPARFAAEDAIIEASVRLGTETFRLSRPSAEARIYLQNFGPGDEWDYRAEMFGAPILGEPVLIALYQFSFPNSGQPYFPYSPAIDDPLSPSTQGRGWQLLSFDPTISNPEGVEGSIESLTATVVPVPAAAWLFASALAGLSRFRRS